MAAESDGWDAVDRYLTETVVGEDEALRLARDASRQGGLPNIEVSPPQGKFLALLCRMSGARRVLEFGTLGGYSTIWLARGVGPQGRVISLELEQRHADVARGNLERAGVADRVEVRIGAAVDSAQAMVASGEPPFDLFFIDADKPNNPRYLALAVELSHPGSVIVVDNVVRNGAIVAAEQDDPRVAGSVTLLSDIGRHPRLDATALQTVGAKGWDGFALAVVR